MTRVYSEAIVEVLDILEHTEKEKVDLIPNRFIKFLKDNCAKDYIVNLDYSKPINEMNIKRETKGILTTICRNWWWNENEKKEYTQLVIEREKQKQEELRKKYNPDEIFNKRKKEIEQPKVQENEQKDVVAMTEYKESIYRKFINWIRNIFKQ